MVDENLSRAASIVDPHPRSLGDRVVGPVAYGCWRLTTDDVSEARVLVETALESGMNLVDTADVYGLDYGGDGFGTAEETLGRVLRDAPAVRERLVLATKGGIDPGVPYDSSDAYLRSACEASLRRLGVERIDLYMVHRPDWFTHPATLAQTLTSLVDDGKIHQIGVSNFTAGEYDALRSHLGDRLVAHQFEFSAAVLDAAHDGTFDACARDDICALAWSPLAGGRLVSGAGLPPELVSTLDGLAEREGVDRACVAVAFVLAQRCRPVAIVGTQRPERIAGLARATRVQLDRRDCYSIVQASMGESLP